MKPKEMRDKPRISVISNFMPNEINMNKILAAAIFIIFSMQTFAYGEETPGSFKDPAMDKRDATICRPTNFPSMEERETEAQRTDGCPCFVPHRNLSPDQMNGCYPRKGNHDNYNNGFFCTYFSDSAKLCEETPYKNGVREGAVRRYDYSPGGKTLHSEINFKGGKEEGVAKFYHYYSGELETEINYTNGLKNGVKKDYFKNGKIQTETLYNNGNEEGLIKKYDGSGNDITLTACLHPSVKCLPEQQKASTKALEERRRESGIAAGPLSVNANEWFAYVDHHQAEQVILLSKGKCPVKWAVKNARNAKVFLPASKIHIPACWYETDNTDDNGEAIVLVCRRDLKEMGNSCNRYSKRHFLSTQSLPRSGF
jgi:hypothetical protein